MIWLGFEVVVWMWLMYLGFVFSRMWFLLMWLWMVMWLGLFGVVMILFCMLGSLNCSLI